jgi:hypothetical protein
MQNFKNTLTEIGYNQVIIPEKGQTFQIWIKNLESRM